MSKGARMRLLMQAGVFVTKIDGKEFIEFGGGASDDKPKAIPYDPEIIKAMLGSGRMM